MEKYKKAILFAVYLGIVTVALLGLNCKKNHNTEPPPNNVITCTSNISDGCLDDWTVHHTTTGDYINPTAGFLQTLNELSSVPPAAGGPGPTTVDTTTDCMQGKYAALCTSKYFYVNLYTGIDTVFIPGYIGASVLDIPNQTIHLGKPYTLRPKTFHAYYKYAPVSGDSALIQVMLSKFSSGSGKRDTISFNKVIVKNPVTSYTDLELPISYRDTINNPDTLIIVFSASADIKFNDVFHCAGRVGSALWVDDLKFVMP